MYIGDLVELLTQSKNGKPFKLKEKVLVTASTGFRILFCKTNNKKISGCRDGKNISLIVGKETSSID